MDNTLGSKKLKVYNLAYELALKIFVISNEFPKEEKYSLTDQIGRSSRSVCTNIAEAYRKRRYPNILSVKLPMLIQKPVKRWYGLISQKILSI
jgi:hypothetical protein